MKDFFSFRRFEAGPGIFNGNLYMPFLLLRRAKKKFKGSTVVHGLDAVLNHILEYLSHEYGIQANGRQA